MKTIGFCGALFFAFSYQAVAQQPIRVAQIAWSMLTPSERAVIQTKNIVELVAPDSYGVIIDNQGVNESMPGTTGGAALQSLMHRIWTRRSNRETTHSRINWPAEF